MYILLGETATAARSILEPKIACSFYRNICRNRHSNLVPWSEGATFDIIQGNYNKTFRHLGCTRRTTVRAQPKGEVNYAPKPTLILHLTQATPRRRSRPSPPVRRCHGAVSPQQADGAAQEAESRCGRRSVGVRYFAVNSEQHSLSLFGYFLSLKTTNSKKDYSDEYK